MYRNKLNFYDVAPLVGAWIEIYYWTKLQTDPSVAPLVGAWIEMLRDRNESNKRTRRSPRGSVD